MKTIKVISSENRLCECCMEIHDVQEVIARTDNIFKGVEIDYDCRYYYCSLAETYYENEEMMFENWVTMRHAYLEKTNSTFDNIKFSDIMVNITKNIETNTWVATSNDISNFVLEDSDYKNLVYRVQAKQWKNIIDNPNEIKSEN